MSLCCTLIIFSYIKEKMKIIVFVLCVISALTLHLPESHLATFPTGKVTLKSDLGTYLARCNACGPGVYVDSAGVQEKNPANAWAIWTVQTVGTKVAFKADNGKYLSRCNACWKQGSTGGADSVFTNVLVLTGNPWALWTPEDLGNGKWALKGDTGKYLARCNNCVTGGTQTDYAFINVDSAVNNPLAQWTIVNVVTPFLFPLGKVNLIADTGKYLARCNGCGPGIYPDSASVHTTASIIWSTWTAQRVGDNVAFKADNGVYLSRCNNCWTQGSKGGADSAFVQATTPIGNPAAQWTPEDFGNGKWALKGDTGKYLARCSNCVTGSTQTDYAFINAPTAVNNPLAQWTIVVKPFLFPLGKVNLIADTGKYLARCNGCGPGIYPDSASVHTTASIIWSTWTAQRVGDNVAFKADNGVYLSRCNNCWTQGSKGGADSAFVQATTPIGNPVAQWTPVDLVNGKWAFRADNGNYLNRCSNCVTGGVTSDFAFVSGTSQSLPTAQWTVVKV